MPGKTSARYPAFIARLGEYVAAAEEGSLVSRFAEAPADAETKPVGQIPHWMFASGDTLAINAFRALALLASHAPQRARAAAEVEADASTRERRGLAYLEACLEEAMRLWPTTPMLSRETLADTDWGGVDGAGRDPGADREHLPPPRPRAPRLRRPVRPRGLDQRRGGRATGRSTTSAAARRAAPAPALALLLGKAVLAKRAALPARSSSLAPALDPGSAAAAHARLLRAALRAASSVLRENGGCAIASARG